MVGLSVGQRHAVVSTWDGWEMQSYRVMMVNKKVSPT